MACRLFGAKPLSEPMLPYYQLDPKEHISVKFHLKFKSFHSRKCTWQCCLPNSGHLVSLSMFYTGNLRHSQAHQFWLLIFNKMTPKVSIATYLCKILVYCVQIEYGVVHNRAISKWHNPYLNLTHTSPTQGIPLTMKVSCPGAWVTKNFPC